SHAALEALATKDELLRANAWVTDALYGQRPSIHQRRQALEGRPDTWVIGAELEKTKIVVVALHGRSANAGRMLDEVATWIGHDPGVTIIALQGPKNEWYATSYRAP